MTQMKNLLLIAGMHRSGTSATTSAAQELGASLGGPLLEANFANPAGYFELKPIMNVHDDILRSLGQTWDDPRPANLNCLTRQERQTFRQRLVDAVTTHLPDDGMRAIKDPRASRFIPLWLEVFAELGEEPRFIQVCRHPAAVAASLSRRSSMHQELSDALWLSHNSAMMGGIQDHLHAVISFEALAGAPVETMLQVESQLEMSWPHGPKSRRSALVELLDDTLMHGAFEGTRTDPSALSAYKDLCKIQLKPSKAGAARVVRSTPELTISLTAHLAAHLNGLQNARIDELAAKFRKASPEGSVKPPTLAELRRQIAKVEQDLVDLTQTVHDIQSVEEATLSEPLDDEPVEN